MTEITQHCDQFTVKITRKVSKEIITSIQSIHEAFKIPADTIAYIQTKLECQLDEARDIYNYMLNNKYFNKVSHVVPPLKMGKDYV